MYENLCSSGPRPGNDELPSCGLFRRLLVMLYDGVVVIALLFLAAFAALPVTGGQQVALRDPLYTAYLAATWFAYLGWCWGHGGLTLGMRAWRVGLVSTDSRPIGWGRSLLRFALSLVSAVPFGLGFAWSLFDARRLAWHDRLSATRLVLTPRRPAWPTRSAAR